MVIQTRHAKRLQRDRRLSAALAIALVLVIIADIYVSRVMFGR